MSSENYIVPLGSKVDFIGGSQPPKSSFKYEKGNDHIRLLQIRDYKSEEFQTFIPKNTAKKICTKDDVMIGRYGPPIFQILRGLEGAYNVALIKAKPKDNVYNTYLYHFLKQKKLFELINSRSQRTAGQTGIDMETLKQYPFYLPPLPEQKRIAAILDKADELIQKRKKAIQRLDDLLEATFLDMFGDPISNPKGLEIRSLKTITSKIGSGSTPKGGDESYKNYGIPLIRSLNIHNNKFTLKNLAYIDNEQAEKLKNVIVNKDDVLLNITGASVCRCAIVPEDLTPARVNQHVCIIRPKVLPSEFLVTLFNSKKYQSYLYKLASKNGATREALTKEQISNLPIIYSEKISNKFKTIFLKITETKEKQEKQMNQEAMLFGSLQQKAFKGEL